jgi:hypothetical protein
MLAQQQPSSTWTAMDPNVTLQYLFFHKREMQEEDIPTKEAPIDAQSADYLRALRLTCCVLIGILEKVGVAPVTHMNSKPAVSAINLRTTACYGSSSSTHPPIKKHDVLCQTRRRCKLLLRVLEEQHCGGLRETEHEILSHRSLGKFAWFLW